MLRGINGQSYFNMEQHVDMATFDKLQQTVATAAGKKPVQGPFQHLHFGNPDKINVGSK